MDSGQWSKERLLSAVQEHTTICYYTAKEQAPARYHECDTKYYLLLEGSFFAIVGYSRHRDTLGRTHGWTMFGANCNTRERKNIAIAVMMNVMGYTAPDNLDPLDVN